MTTHFQKSGRREQMGTRAMFLAAGLAMAAWAPLVPFAKARAGIDDGSLGLVLLCLGLGSMVAMPLAGMMVSRVGCRTVLAAACIVIASVLPMLALSSDIHTLAISLAIFGAGLGTLDVTVNIQAVMVEKDSGRNMMSGFHGLFSVGGILGAGSVSALLYLGLTPLNATLILSALTLALFAGSARGLLAYGNREAEHTPLIALPKGVLVMIGILCFIAFLGEGAVLDWGALFMIQAHGLDFAAAGIGYAAFSVAMTVGRLTGDRVVQTFGGKRVLVAGGLVAAAGFALVVLAPNPPLALTGFILVGLGASNIVPVLFTAAGSQTRMPANLAIASVTTIAYAGILMGPAAIGGVAELVGLGFAFLLIAAAFLFVAATGARTLAS